MSISEKTIGGGLVAKDLLRLPADGKFYTANHTIDASDFGKIIFMDSGSANTLTIPSDEEFSCKGQAIPDPWQTLQVVQWGAGATSLAAGTGVTILSNSLEVSAQYKTAFAVRVPFDSDGSVSRSTWLVVVS